MATKFQAHYNLMIQFPNAQVPGETIQYITKDPITISFSISKGAFQQTNTATIQVHNMDSKIRNSIYQENLDFGTRDKFVALYAGYGDNLTLCTQGTIIECYSSLSSTDIITYITINDFNNIFGYSINKTFNKGTSYIDAIKTIAGEIPNITLGEIGEIQGVFEQETTISGDALEELNKLTGGNAFIEDNTLNILLSNETIGQQAYVIDSSSGLLSTPALHDKKLEISMLFEPSIRLGRWIEIRSATQQQYDGQYKVIAYTHDCTISGSQAGSRITTLQAMKLDVLPNPNVNLTNGVQKRGAKTIVDDKAIPIDESAPSDVIGVRNYLEKHNGAIPNIYIEGTNKKFKWVEFIGHGNTNSERLQELTIPILTRIKQTAVTLNSFVKTYFGNRKITINSGWRSKRNNASLEGSAQNSLHLKGEAVDFMIAGFTKDSIFQKFYSNWKWGYVYKGKKYNFVHAQIGGNSNKGYRG